MGDRPSFFELADQLDMLIPLEAPTPKQTYQVLTLIEDEALQRYFIRHLAVDGNPGWFEALRERGFFDGPPDPVEREGRVLYPPWPVLQYLVAIARESPEEVIEVARRLHSRDSWAMVDLVRAAATMPPAKAAQMVPLTVRWAGEGMMVEESVVSLANFLAREDQWDAALVLVDLILSPEPEEVSDEAKQSPFFSPRAISKAREYAVQIFLERDFAFFVEQRPLDIARIVTSNLGRAIAIETRDGRDSSFVWRSAIESHDQNTESDDIKHQLVDTAERTLSFLAESKPDCARDMVEQYLRHDYSVFRRLAIHIVRLNAHLWPDLLESLFAAPHYVGDIEVFHEYWMLMRDTYASLSKSVQDDFLQRLLGELPQQGELEEEQYHRERCWVLRRLCAIGGHLSSNHRVVLNELVEQYGKPEHPSFLIWSSTWSGSASTETSEHLCRMSHEEVLAELRRELPVEGFGEPSQAGLARALRAAVEAKPEHFVPIAPKLVVADIAPTYVQHVLWGFREAWKEQKVFDWEPVLQLCEKVARTSGEVTYNGQAPDMVPGYWQTTYASARTAVADLLQGGVVRDDHAITVELLGRVRDILLILADDPNPSPEYEQKWRIEHPAHMVGLTRHVTRSRAIEALIRFALHVSTIRTKGAVEFEGELFPPGSRLEAVVRDKLTQKLNMQADPSLAVHSLFGEYLPQLHYLDEEWTKGHLGEIFPREPEMADYWEAAWDGYLFHSRFYAYLFDILRPYYRHAIKQMELGTKPRSGLDASHQRLARQLGIVYWHGIEALGTEDSLIALFFDSAPDDIRAGFIIGLGVALREGTEGTLSSQSEEWLRAKTLWKARFEVIGQIVLVQGQATGIRKELAAFADWVPFIPDNLKGFYDMIEMSALASENPTAIRLVEFLSSVVEEHIHFAVTLFDKLLQQGRGPWFFRTERPAARTILEAAMSSNDEEACSCAVRVINLFGERGEERYRDLLKLG